MFSKPRTISFVILLLMSMAFSSYSALWTEVLSETVIHTEKAGIMLAAVNYEKIIKDAETHKKYREILQFLSIYNPNDLPSKSAKMAFWINVYNVAAVKMIVNHYPLKSIRDKSEFFTSVWDKKIITVGGIEYSLGHIEHEILRKMGEPRVHFAIVCASLSCPDIRSEAYAPDLLEEQLENQALSFINNPTKGLKISTKDGLIEVSSIFKWFEKDFKDKEGVVRFISQYSGQKLNSYKLKYLDYNWDLNSL